MNKLGFYLEVTNTPGLADAIREVKPPTLLTHANDKGLLQEIRRWLSPETFVVGRLHLDPHVQDAWLDSDDPEGKGREFAEKILDLDHGGMALERGENDRLLIDAWMSLNECVPGPASDVYRRHEGEDEAELQKRRKEIEARYNAYDRLMVAFRNRLKEKDDELEAVAFNFGAGNFQKPDHYLNWFPRTLETYTYLGFHEYGWPALSKDLHPDTKSAAGDYQRCMKGIRERYGERFKVIITEAGLARLYKHIEHPPGDVGWLYEGDTISEDDYWRSLEWYNRLLCEDDYVLGSCLFEVGHSGNWETFRHLGVDNEGKPLRIIDKIKSLTET
jgi:hypothetical protein